MDTAEQFFYEHAGWSHDPEKETSEQGRERCARELAKAERDARAAGLFVTVDNDPDVEEDDAGGAELVASGEYVNLSVILWRPDYVDTEGLRHDPTMLGSLFGIVVKNDSDPYLRVVAAELAMEYGD